MDLHDRPGDDYLPNKGDLCELSLSYPHADSHYIKLPEVQRVSIIAYADDGWNIGSIVTLVSDSRNTQMLTKDFDVNWWIDGGGDTSHKRFVLILSPPEVNAGE